MLIIKSNKILIFFIVLTVLCTLSAINATNIAEDSTDNTNSITPTDEHTVDMVESDINQNTVNKKITKKQINKNNTKSASNVGNTDELNNLIRNTNSKSIKLDKDYVLDNLKINKQITIDGQGHTLSGDFKTRILVVKADNVVIKNINFINGFNKKNKYGSAIYWDGDNGLISNCTFRKNQFAKQDPNNRYDVWGAAVHSEGKSLKIEDSTFIENAGEYGNAIYVDASDNVISNCTFKDNIYYIELNRGDDYSTVEDIVLNAHYQCKAGGAIYVNDQRTTIKNCVFDSNKAYHGSAIYVNKKNNVIDNCKFLNNTAQNISAVYIDAKGCQVNNCYFVNNRKIYYSIDFRPSHIYSTENVSVGTCWWGNLKSSTIKGIEGNIIMKNKYYLDVIDLKNGDNLESMEKISAQMGGKNTFDLVLIQNDTQKIVNVSNDPYFDIIRRDNINRQVNNANTSIIFNKDNTELEYVPINGYEGAILVTYNSKRFDFGVKHTAGSTFTDLQKLFLESHGKTINLTQDYRYNPSIDAGIANGMHIGSFTVEGNGHTLYAQGSKTLFDITGKKTTFKNLNIVNSTKTFTGSSDLTLINVTAKKTKNFISMYGKVNLINSSIINESNKAISIKQTSFIKTSGQVILNNSKIINALKGITDYCDIIVNNSTFDNVKYSISNKENVTIENSKFINNDQIINCPANISVNNCNFTNITYLIYSEANPKSKHSNILIINNSMIRNADTDKYIIDAYKTDMNINNSTFTDIKSTKQIITIENCPVTITDSSFVNNNVPNIIEITTKYSKDPMNITRNIILKNSIKYNLIEASQSENINVNNNWYGNSINNYDKKLIKSSYVDDWAILDVHYNNDETELIIELNERYNQSTNKIESFEGINTEFNVTFNDITQPVTLTNGKGVMNIKDATRSEIEKVTVDYYSKKFNFELKRKIGSFTDMKNLIETGNNTITLDINYQYNNTSDKDITKGVIINKPITIDGNGHTIDGSYKSLIFNVQSDNVTIKNIELKKGNHDELAGAIYWNASNGKLLNSTLTENFAPNGGAIYLAKDSNMINSSKFIENEAGLYGGAIYVGQKDTTITNNRFENNRATAGDNYAVYISKEDYVKEFENNTFINNTKTDYGGDASDENDDNDNRINKKTVTQNTNIKYQKKQEKTVYTKITVNNRDIPIINNQLTLDTLMKIFNQDFTNGHLVVYIDGRIVYNGTTTDDLTQVIYDLIKIFSGKHEIKVEFTDSQGKTNTYTENITI